MSEIMNLEDYNTFSIEIKQDPYSLTPYRD